VKAAKAVPPTDIRSRMDRMYRPQKLVYDLTRRYYLIGRDRLIEGLAMRPGERLLDLGCGTGRNLALTARRWPGTMLLGVDAAAPMLEVAEARIARDGLAGRARLARGIGESLDVEALFGEPPGLDHVTISYALSMMDDPVAALDRALAVLRPGGRLHIVDFGPMTGVPAPLRAGLRAWLAAFHVHHRPEVEAHLRAAQADGAGRLAAERLLGGYALILRFTRPATGS
jgi:S-adenosylmethionine-diacylgycerolhomoserine-N-methlytransferase